MSSNEYNIIKINNTKYIVPKFKQLEQDMTNTPFNLAPIYADNSADDSIDSSVKATIAEQLAQKIVFHFNTPEELAEQLASYNLFDNLFDSNEGVIRFFMLLMEKICDTNRSDEASIISDIIDRLKKEKLELLQTELIDQLESESESEQ